MDAKLCLNITNSIITGPLHKCITMPMGAAWCTDVVLYSWQDKEWLTTIVGIVCCVYVYRLYI